MTERKMQKLKDTALDTLDDMENIDVDKLTKDQFILLGSAYGIINANISAQSASVDVSDVETVNIPPNEENAPESKITLLQRELKSAFHDYETGKAEYMQHQTADYG